MGRSRAENRLHYHLKNEAERLEKMIRGLGVIRTAEIGFTDIVSCLRRCTISTMSSCCVTLLMQRRMHPQMADILRASLYPTLQDGHNVLSHPSGRGISQRLFFFDHQHEETKESQSYCNSFEAEMCVHMVRYLVRQGYGQVHIAVLTPYVGQPLLLTRLVQTYLKLYVEVSEQDELLIVAVISPNSVADPTDEDPDSAAVPSARIMEATRARLRDQIRLSTMDNFQGEEAAVVIVSTVRCNTAGRCGFLKEDNGVNVMPSRAKHGMMVFGSARTVRQVGRKRRECSTPLST
jgi:superfamily I DNA and/or RNA helicase